MRDRNQAVDCVRAILVLSVMLFHYTIAWADEKPDIYGFDGHFSRNLTFLALAVQVFFLISGFFITVTIFRSKDAFEFLYRRIVRIFPALIVSAALTMVIVNALGPPVLSVMFSDYLGSINLIFRFGTKWVDGAYWSLVVEVKYYLWVAAFFAILGARFWIGLVALAFVGAVLSLPYPQTAESMFLAPYLSYFLAGMGAAYQTVGRRKRPAAVLYIAAAIAFLVQLDQMTPWQNGALLIACGLVLFLLISDIHIKLPILPYLGVISYEIYLIHQKVGITTIGILKHTFDAPDLVAIASAAMVSVALAAFVHHIAQRPLAAAVRGGYRWMRGEKGLVDSSPGRWRVGHRRGYLAAWLPFIWRDKMGDSES
jgi:peptidoglycan/LPS O-acetylase OafA/YrhL